MYYVLTCNFLDNLKKIEYGQIAIELYIQARARSQTATVQSVIQVMIANSQLLHGTTYPGKHQYLAFLDLILAEHQLEEVSSVP